LYEEPAEPDLSRAFSLVQLDEANLAETFMRGSSRSSVMGVREYLCDRRPARESDDDERHGDGDEADDLNRHACSPCFSPIQRADPHFVPRSSKDLAMALERTFSIIKPDATRRNLTDAVNNHIEKAGLRIIAQKRIRMSRAEAEGFYAVHRERPFFKGLVTFMTSGPVIVQVLEGENAVAKYREVMGATDPAKAAPGTIRKDLAESIEANSVHGSDSPENAKQEIAFFFPAGEIVG
jgi:nucleoside-diphosphate kinase